MGTRRFVRLQITLRSGMNDLKAVVLKAAIGTMGVREAVAQRPPDRYPGEKYAPATCGTRT